MKTYTAYLTYDELMLLDGKVRDDVQKVVDTAKSEHSFGLDDVANEILENALKAGELRWGSINISSCKCCDKKSGYTRYSRSSRWHRKGDINYDKPIRYSGVLINPGVIVVEGLPGICWDCWKKTYLPKIVNYIHDNNLPIQTNDNDIAPTRWKKDVVRECANCGTKSLTSTWGRSHTIFGNGTYPSTCPHCDAFNSGMPTKEFKMVEVAQSNDKNT